MSGFTLTGELSVTGHARFVWGARSAQTYTVVPLRQPQTHLRESTWSFG
jgi:hypothetical protein